MAIFTITSKGNQAIIDALDDFEGDLDQTSVKAIDQSLDVVERSAKKNLTQMLTMDYSRGMVLYNSISHTAVIAKDGSPSGTVGVFDMPSKTGDNKKVSGRRITAPLVAFFHQYGTQEHSLAQGSRAERRPSTSLPRGAPAKGQDIKPIHPGFGPSPFLDNAWFGNINKIEEITVRNLKKVGD